MGPVSVGGYRKYAGSFVGPASGKNADPATIAGSPDQSPSDTDLASLDVDLVSVIVAWPSLPEAIKAGIMAIVTKVTATK